MQERRQLPRQRTFKGGAIVLDPAGTVECVVRNLSAIGACLEVTNLGALPNSFSLIIKPEAIKRSCEVVWRSANRIGVKFTT